MSWPVVLVAHITISSNHGCVEYSWSSQNPIYDYVFQLRTLENRARFHFSINFFDFNITENMKSSA